MSIYKLLSEYKTLAKSIVIEVGNDGDIESFVNEREKILESIIQMNLPKEDLKQIIGELEIMEEDNKMFKAIKDERIQIKKELNDIKIRRMANNKYSSNSSMPTFFNKTI